MHGILKEGRGFVEWPSCLLGAGGSASVWFLLAGPQVEVAVLGSHVSAGSEPAHMAAVSPILAALWLQGSTQGIGLTGNSPGIPVGQSTTEQQSELTAHWQEQS